MKHYLLTLLALLVCTVSVHAGVYINETYFPDSHFRYELNQRYDPNHDGYLSDAELAAITTLNVRESSIQSLKGIEYFTALQVLLAEGNTNLSYLNVSSNTALKELECYNCNALPSLNVSANRALEKLSCSHCELVTSLSLGNNTALKTLWCDGTGISSLNLYYNTALENLSCDNCQLTSLDLSRQTALKSLQCSSMNLTQLSLNCQSTLEMLWCSGIGLTSLNLNSYTKLEDLNCGGCSRLTSLDVLGCTALKQLRFNDCPITSIDLSTCTALQKLNCWRTQLTTLSLINRPNLEEVEAQYNDLLTTVLCNMNPKLQYLYLNGCSALTHLYCNYDELTYLSAINITGCDALQVLQLTGNKFTSLSIYSMPSLTNLEASGNANLTSAYVYNNPKLEIASLDNCQNLATISCYNNPMLTHVGITSDPALKTANIYSNASLASLDMSWNTALETLKCNDNALTSLYVASCTSLQTVNCDNNKLTSLPQNAYMTSLSIMNNRLDDVILSPSNYGTTSLSLLYVSGNPMEQFDCINIPTLTQLSAKDCTYLTRATLSNNPALKRVYMQGCTRMSQLNCSNNAINILRVTDCPALRNVECYNNQLDSAHMTKLIDDLPTIPTSEAAGKLRILAYENEGNEFTDTHQAAATAKRWNSLMSDGTPVGESSNGMVGDINHDNKVDVGDVNIVINIMLGKAQASAYPGNADVNSSGSVDVSDVNKIINILLGKEPGGYVDNSVVVTYDYTTAASLQALGFSTSEINVPIEGKDLSDGYAWISYVEFFLKPINGKYCLAICDSNEASQQGWDYDWGWVEWYSKNDKMITKVVIETTDSFSASTLGLRADNAFDRSTEGLVLTYTFDDEGARSFSCEGSGVKINKITVTYK